MGSCCTASKYKENHLNNLPTSPSGQSASTIISTQITEKQPKYDSKKQIKRIRHLLKIFHQQSLEVDKLRDLMLSKLKLPRKYQKNPIDQLFSQCYYHGNLSAEDILTIPNEIKEISLRLQPYLIEGLEVLRFSISDSSFLENLRNCLKKAGLFIESAENFPQIPISQPSSNCPRFTIKELVPDLSDSCFI